VNQASGLHRATLSWHCFTDWDIGTYILSMIFARKLNLISHGLGHGDWQFTDRINRLLTFLQDRSLSGQTPYWAYDWATGTPCSDASSALTDAADQGRLLGALHALIAFRSTYASQVASIFERSHSEYDTLSTELGPDYYSYFMADGFAAFGYNESAVFNAINSYGGPYYTVYGQQLPVLNTLAEPFNLVILEGPMIGYAPSSTFLDFANRDYLAQMGRWSATGNLTAWSEGVYLPGIDYIDEWVLYPSKALETWTLMDAGGRVYSQPPYQPFAYTKVAFSFLAIYGENPYTDALVNAVTPLANPTEGFGEATFENGVSAISPWGSKTGGFYADKTNEQVLAAAAYATSHTTTSTGTLTTSHTSISSSISTYSTSSGSITEGNAGSIMSTSTSNSISTPTMSTPIPGFSWTSIIMGIMLGLSILAARRSRNSAARVARILNTSTQRES
jgi:Protein of unknown function (DUF3131)